MEIFVLRVMSICVQIISQALLLKAGEENVFTVVFPGRDKGQGGLLSCFLRTAFRDVFIGLFCLFFCMETVRALCAFSTRCWCETKHDCLHGSQQKA